MEPTSGLAFIDVKHVSNNNPSVLFNEWLKEAKENCANSAYLMNLATSSKDGDVSNRTLLLRDITDGLKLIIMTNENGKKIKHIKENPKVAACFLWIYLKGDKRINRQVCSLYSLLLRLIEITESYSVGRFLKVRIEGIASPLPDEKCQFYYAKEPLFCKIRSHICQQGEVVDWNDLKQKHDQLLREVLTEAKDLKMPSYQVAYQIEPFKMDFYYSWDNHIADRVLFTKTGRNDWESQRIAT